MRMFVGVLACLLVLLAGSATADSGVLTLNAYQESNVATFGLKAGDVVEYTWSSGFPVELHITRQGAGEVFNTTSQASHGTFSSTADGTYVFSFRAQGSSLNMVSWDITKKTDPTMLIALGGLAAAAAAGGGIGIGLWSRKRHQATATSAQAPPPPPPQ